ncbi:hypothetical protein LOM8899_03404 [Flavimaricola marinus]|uniref:Uncharacterized protein n=2 Tax=Flavimaricola marinus TaxID=1819565 RepID=A0A238LHS5_9RHOB|nr:hypothetical protein LOM8899_03404 [Flavimaricola marinus]
MPLRERADYGIAEPLFSTSNSTGLAPGVMLHLDPEARFSGTWSSPDGRLVEMHTEATRPGAWFGLHIALPGEAADLGHVRWIGIVARTSALHAAAIRVGLRSGLAEGGFQDSFFGRHILSQPRQSDHHDLLCPADLPDLPQRADWRELVLFLPPAAPLDWVLHDLRIYAL